MRSVFEEPQEVSDLLLKIRQVSEQLVRSINPEQSNLLLPAADNFEPPGVKQDKLYLLTEGTLLLLISGQVILHFEPGDFLWPEFFDLPNSNFSTEFAVRTNVYSFTKLISVSDQHKILWDDLSRLRIQALTLILASQVKGQRPLSPTFQRFEAGTVMIEQGDASTEVYTLLEGEALVYVDSVEVGRIIPNEVFGALAALTETVRTARIVAATPCLAISIPKERFLELIEERPLAVFKLIEDMAKNIVQLNEKVVKLSGDRSWLVKVIETQVSNRIT